MGRAEAGGRCVWVWGKERRGRGGRGARKKKRKETISIKFDIVSPPPRISNPVSPYLVSPPPAVIEIATNKPVIITPNNIAPTDDKAAT